jgi:hypothetical protein
VRWHVRADWYFDRKHRALARPGSDIDGMTEQASQTLHDRETEADALAALACRIVQLMEFLENRRKFL